MNRVVPAFLSIGWLMAFDASAQAFRSSVAPLIQGSCVHCHDADTKTELKFPALKTISRIQLRFVSGKTSMIESTKAKCHRCPNHDPIRNNLNSRSAR